MNVSKRIAALAEWSIHHRAGALVAAAVLFVSSVLGATTLNLEASYTAMVPETEVEVAESRGLVGALASTQVLNVLVRGEPAARLAFARAAADRLRTHPEIVTVELEYPVESFERNWFATLSPQEQEHLAGLITAAARAEVRAQNPLFADLGDGDRWAEVETAIEQARASQPDLVSLQPNGSIRTSADGSGIWMTVRPRVTMLTPIGDYEDIVSSMRDALGGVESSPGTEWKLSGQMLVALDEYRLIRRDLGRATGLAFLLVIVLLVVATRRLTTIPVVAAPLVVGFAMTLGLTALLVGRLNIVSAFMLPALLGLGVDFCIHLYAAYESALRDAEPRDAMLVAVREQWRPCGVAALTTAAGFVALLICRFDGIREFGIIASVGVLSMYVACFLVFPPIATAMVKRPRSSAFGPVPRSFHKLLIPVALLLGVAAASAFTARFHNDFKALRGDLPSDAQHQALMRENAGPFEPTLIGVASPEEARRVALAARERRAIDEGPASIGRVVTLPDFLPAQIPEPRREMLEALQRVRGEDQAQRVELEVMGAWARGEAWSVDGLPRSLVETLRPRPDLWLVAVFSTDELHAEEQFSAWRDHIDAIRGAVKRDGIAIRVADKWSIVTKMLQLIRDAIAPMTVAAFGLVGLVLVATRRRGERRLPSVVAVVVGTAACAGIAGWLGQPFNIFNIVVLPAVFGIGIDNAVQMSDAVATAESPTSPEVTRRAAACALSSTTTALGFGAMLVAAHPGINSLGVTALVGLLATFTASTVALPAWLIGRARTLSGNEESS